MSATTEEVAQRAGVGVGTVFRHFPTKEALLEAILVERVARLAEHARSLATASDPGRALLDLFRHMVEQSAEKKMYVDALPGGGLDSIGRSGAHEEAVA